MSSCEEVIPESWALNYAKPPEPKPDFHGSGHLEWCEDNDALGNPLKKTSDITEIVF